MNKELMFSSKDMTWSTPQDFYDKLHSEFNFNLDSCCEIHTAKCPEFFTKEDDGLTKDWAGKTVFCNPPYGRELGVWVEKCYNEAQKPGTTVVMLIPSRTDTQYFHNYIYKKAGEVRFIKGRLKFGGAQNPAPFPSMVVVFRSQT